MTDSDATAVAGPASTATPPSCRPADLDAVRDALVDWYEADHREFPWRRTEDPTRSSSAR